uniref:Neurotransmitter-gated ion-channel ligand-binding domain-containing protein n=1 Tax=Strigamia maritima TaxID=126957 RepID=T1JBH8_STRMM
MIQTWYDYSFHWNEEEYGGINVLRIPAKYLWLPDVVLENGAEASQSKLAEYRSNVLAYPNGQILWVPSATRRISCAVNLHKFPFDSHVCTFNFRSWAIDGKTLKLELYSNSKRVDLSDFMKGNEWEVEDASEKVVYKSTDKDVALNFAISLKRRTYFYILTFIIPVLLSWVFMLVLFWFPISNQRIFLASLTVVYLEILLLQLRWSIPNNGSVVPIIVVICGQSIIFAALLLVFSVALKAMLKTAYPRRLPIKLKTVLHRWLSCVLCVQQNRIHEVTTGAQLLNNSSVELNIDKFDQNEIYCDWVLLMTVLNRLVIF